MRKTLQQLLAYHETAAAAVRATLVLLNGSPTPQAIGEPPKQQHERSRRFTAATLLKQRTATGKMLARFNAKQPLTAAQAKVKPQRLGVLVHHGYLKAQGEGYVRTDKQFTA